MGYKRERNYYKLFTSFLFKKYIYLLQRANVTIVL